MSAAEYADGVFCCGYGLVGVFVFHDDDVGDVVWRAVCPWLCHDEVWVGCGVVCRGVGVGFLRGGR